MAGTGAGGGVPQLFRALAVGASVIVGAIYTVGAVAGSIHRRNSALKREKHGKPCGVCKGRGYYTCKLCKAKGTIQWSPLYDPLVINPCVCPTCEGNKVQKCLNCLGFGLV
ncbi:PREDICTED: uncharacterized protein LOC109162895 [Ipomoea nil]|uniref:uncharacterized protein LOC109162895 n=1 Tax=Ipomoea nil TaxID=35883 RepID=UPI000901032E|nr:PREDICTED: uncharacterized protein LOC109162895 [Ipomoea nil]